MARPQYRQLHAAFRRRNAPAARGGFIQFELIAFFGKHELPEFIVLIDHVLSDVGQTLHQRALVAKFAHEDQAHKITGRVKIGFQRECAATDRAVLALAVRHTFAFAENQNACFVFFLLFLIDRSFRFPAVPQLGAL